MSAKTIAKPRIAIVGAGNLATALAVALHRAGYEVGPIVSRGRKASVERARRLARAVGASVLVVCEPREKGTISFQADVVWFCVPDGAIASAARSMMRATDWEGKVALHSSGALSSDELGVLQRRGAAVGSAHPLMTFVRGARPPLDGVPFAIEGDAAAARGARRIVKDMGGYSYSIRKSNKPAYHAWGTFASPLFDALLATAEQVAAAAQVSRTDARRRMSAILRQTLANYAALGAAGAFSGPIARGEVKTVKRHLQALRPVPQACEVYIALAKAALHYLPSGKRNELIRLLGKQTGPPRR